ncbi:hypothetical protein D3C80_1112610 [compost metagenome]
MCQRQWSPACHLFLKQWDYRTVRTEHISKPGDDKTSFGSNTTAAHIDFSHPFGRPHDIRRIDRLVCGHHHHFLCPILHTEVSNILASDYICLNGFIRVGLHQRYMFICCCMKYKIRFVLSKYILHKGEVAHIANNTVQMFGLCCFYRLLNIIQGGLSLIQ